MDKKNSLTIQFRTETSNDCDLQFADFIIDGKSLFDQFRKYDVVPSLGWGIKEYQDEMVSYFLMQKPHPLLWYRVPVLVCSHCGDLECGFISAKIERIGNTIVWKDFYK
ncbi:oxidoreductase [Brevibacillus laterosporus]|uniref:Oxidoreductase n=1 Tax=Brevibacillus laterosporus TaxID=1465 RepID=A0A518V8V5_BRELA|nr:oxidoreductase [Brevibacillus laterosporus]